MATVSHLKRVGDGQRDSQISETLSLNQYSLCKFSSSSWKIIVSPNWKQGFHLASDQFSSLQLKLIKALGQGMLGVTKSTITVEI